VVGESRRSLGTRPVLGARTRSRITPALGRVHGRQRPAPRVARHAPGRRAHRCAGGRARRAHRRGRLPVPARRRHRHAAAADSRLVQERGRRAPRGPHRVCLRSQPRVEIATGRCVARPLNGSLARSVQTIAESRRLVRTLPQTPASSRRPRGDSPRPSRGPDCRTRRGMHRSP